MPPDVKAAFLDVITQEIMTRGGLPLTKQAYIIAVTNGNVGIASQDDLAKAFGFAGKKPSLALDAEHKHYLAGQPEEQKSKDFLGKIADYKKFLRELQRQRCVKVVFDEEMPMGECLILAKELEREAAAAAAK